MAFTAKIADDMPIKRIENDDGIKIYDQLSLKKIEKSKIDETENISAVALSSLDNPFNPFTEFDKWYTYDKDYLGYDSCGYLAKESFPVDSLSSYDQLKELERAIDVIVSMNLNGMYVKLTKD